MCIRDSFVAADNQRPDFTVQDALDNPQRDTARVVLPPASYVHEREKYEKRLPAAIDYIVSNGLNEFFGSANGRIGIVLQGGMYNGVIRALQRLGLADLYGDSAIPLYVLNVTYPLVPDQFLDFCRDKDHVLIIEEGQPDFIEESLRATLHRAGMPIAVSGKDVLPMAGEYTGAVMLEGVSAFLTKAAPHLLPDIRRAPNQPEADPDMPDLSKTVPPKAKRDLVRTAETFDKDCQRLERQLKRVKVCPQDRLEVLLCLQHKGVPSVVGRSVLAFLV